VADGCEGKDSRSFPDGRVARNRHVRDKFDAGTQHYMRSDHAERANLHILGKRGAGLDDSRPMNHWHRGGALIRP
jgi:hypothetical protein